MGPTTINGLPAHPMLVHFVAVLVPVAALMLLLSVFWPAARRRLGIITPLIALVTLILVPLTTHAGEWLEHRTERDPLVRAHAQIGDQLLYWSFGVFVVAAVWWLVHDDRTTAWLAARAHRVNAVAAGRAATITLTAIALVLAVGSVIQDYRIGESGAKAVWHDQAQVPTAMNR